MSESSDRLAITRLAIIEHVLRKKEGRRGPAASEETVFDAQAQEVHTAPPRARARPRRSDRFSVFADAGREYWRQHPLRLAAELATPALTAYAQRKPMQYLGLAVAAGALLVLARPWKLISVTGLLLAALRSPQFSGLVISAVSAAGSAEQTPHTE